MGRFSGNSDDTVSSTAQVIFVKGLVSLPIISKHKKATQEQCNCKVAIEKKSLKQLVYTVWICLKAMI